MAANALVLVKALVNGDQFDTPAEDKMWTLSEGILEASEDRLAWMEVVKAWAVWVLEEDDNKVVPLLFEQYTDKTKVRPRFLCPPSQALICFVDF